MASDELFIRRTLPITMGAFIRQLFLLVWLGGFVFSLVSVANHWGYDFKAPDVEKMLSTRVDTLALKQSLEEALRAEEYDEARSLLTIGKHYGHPLEYDVYERYLLAKDTTSKRLTKQISGFAEGFVSGKSSDASGVAGALVADFTVIGDVRDLGEQYSRYQQGLPVNQLIASLAGVGVGLTAASIGTFGAATPVKAGASTLKLATRMNRLSRSFRNELAGMASRVFDWQKFLRMSKSADLADVSRIAKQAYNPQAARKISILAEQANDIRKSTSVADSVHLLQYVDSTVELGRLHRVTQRYGAQTRGIFRLLGKSAIRGIKTLKVTLELLISITTSIFFALLFIATIGGNKKQAKVA